MINNDLDIELNKKKRDTKLIARRFEDILSSLSSDRKNSGVKFKNMSLLQRVSHNFWPTCSEVCSEFPKFATNLSISLRTCQSNCELGNKVVNFTPNFVRKLTSSLQEKFAPFGEIVSEFPRTLWSRWLVITSFKMGYNTLQLNFPRCHPIPA